MAVTQSSKIMLHDLLRWNAQDQRLEIVHGEPIPMTPAGFLHVMIAGNVYRALYDFATQHRLGYVCGDSLVYILEQDEEQGLRQVRIPDASFIRKGRLPKDFNLSDPFPGAPDLAIEVMSPDDSATDVLAKIRTYFAAGTEQVWVLYPEQQEVHQYIHSETQVRIYTRSDAIDANALFPGLTLIAQDLFILPDIEE